MHLDDVREVYQLLSSSQIERRECVWVETSRIPILIVMSRSYVRKHAKQMCVKVSIERLSAPVTRERK